MVHVGWSALSVGFLALYLASSINQALSNGVQDTDGCESFQPIYGGALLHHVYQTLRLPGSIYCLRACDDDIRCQSINHVVHGEICELNNRTKEARPEDFTTDVTKVYMKKFRKRATIGSIPEVPAESCNEVKTSEKGRDGKYWLSSIIPGRPVFAYCDMKTGSKLKKGNLKSCSIVENGAAGVRVLAHLVLVLQNQGVFLFETLSLLFICYLSPDADECTASPPVCHVKALCTNTNGSHRCTCKRGYTGNGTTCTDIDECTASTPVCGIHFKCFNTLGSYRCQYNSSREGCQGILLDKKQKNLNLSDGLYTVSVNSTSFQAYCDMTSSGQAWTLIARFSNNDVKNWMEDSGEWWYDKSVSVGDIAKPSVNADMLSPAFWLVKGREFKITRSDDPEHTALLQTTGECLSGKTFRAKITSYGNFRNGRVWAENECQGNCNIQYDGPLREMLVSFLLYGEGLFGTLPCTSQVLFSNPFLQRVPASVVSV
ncbi:PREDICTED: uncharacterized protein LOC107329265 [Acropora digitifera]|uniref:uncharacterized protein LOC107329265 n=1 Tax=Acropora digitifera TaxID=70779 RepID=UPI00077A9C14|nr:PREDICTED: uncharacterized protein LOC107329265 [Acropora digitifera]